jgi:hypothetical protein
MFCLRFLLEKSNFRLSVVEKIEKKIKNQKIFFRKPILAALNHIKQHNV